MPDADKLHALHKELQEHAKKLEEMEQRYGHHEPEIHPEAARQHMHSMGELIASTRQTVINLIEVLGQAGL